MMLMVMVMRVLVRPTFVSCCYTCSVMSRCGDDDDDDYDDDGNGDEGAGQTDIGELRLCLLCNERLEIAVVMLMERVLVRLALVSCCCTFSLMRGWLELW